MRTYVAKGEEAEALKEGASWFVVDATNVVLGRLATKVARMLIGKDKPSFTPYLDSGDHVVVINADKVRMTGNKVEQKIYYSHSGYPGGLKEVPAKRLREVLAPRTKAAIRPRLRVSSCTTASASPYAMLRSTSASTRCCCRRSCLNSCRSLTCCRRGPRAWRWSRPRVALSRAAPSLRRQSLAT